MIAKSFHIVWVTDQAGGVTTQYHYDGPQVIAEYENSTLTRKFIYGTGIDEPICMIDIATDTYYFYHYDGLGSIVALSNMSGQIVERYEYSAFGQTQIFSASHQPRATSDYNNPYMFTGQRFDDETGLYYYRARMYHPELGRFMQPDPIGYQAGINLYAYVGNNSTNWIDPLGLVIYDHESTENILRHARESRYAPVLHMIPSQTGPSSMHLGSGIL